MVYIRLRAKGMHCPSCEILVTEALEEQEGVNSVQASFVTGLVDVDFDGTKIDEKKMIEVIQKQGYEVEK